MGRTAPLRLEFEHPPIECARSRQPVLTNVPYGFFDQRVIFEHQELRLEDSGLHRPQSILR